MKHPDPAERRSESLIDIAVPNAIVSELGSQQLAYYEDAYSVEDLFHRYLLRPYLDTSFEETVRSLLDRNIITDP